MFCKNCGTELNDTAKFCPKCGNATSIVFSSESNQSKINIVDDNTVKLQVKPEFNVPYKIITTIGRAFIYMFFICFLFTELYRLWFIFPYALLLTFVAMAVYVIVKLLLQKKQYDDLEYNFYTTKIEYKDGFLNKEEKELKYKHIREITMNQNILERMFDIGTIRIFTNASSGSYGYGRHNDMRGKNGIFIHCVENVAEQYQTIKQIIEDGTPEE